MLCKDCLHFKQWKKIEACVCKKTNQPVDNDQRLCDDFISKSGLTDEWGELTCDAYDSCK